MAKIRVFEAAKEHGHEVQDLLGALVNLGVKVRSHLSPVDEEDVARALAALGGTRTGREEPSPTAPTQRVVRRRRKKDEGEGDGVTEVVATGAAEEDHTVPAVEPAEESKPEPEPKTEPEPIVPAQPEPEPPTEEPATEAAPPPEETPVEGAAETPQAPGTEAEEGGIKLKVVRFIHDLPQDSPASPARTPDSGYHMTKAEREARRATKRTRRKKGRRQDTQSGPKRAAQKTQITVPKAIKRKIRVSEVISISELSQRMGVKGTELIRQLMTLGVMATINQTIDADTAALVASEFGYEVENITVGEEEILAQVEDQPADLVSRPPVVTVMGHVDHGKTSLLDAIRETRVAEGEAGGITQHIGAYEVDTSRGRLVFLDTPGHEAFTALRARGAQVTDITVLVVAADDGIMPQTVEAIDHSKAAGVPVIVAINKMDRPDANPDLVKRGLTEHDLAPEDWGGDVICVPVSAKHRTGIDDLLEMLVLQAEVMELKANPNKEGRGVVVEARVDRGRGPVSTVLVQAGTLRVGDIVISGPHFGRVRALLNDQGKRILEAGPSTPVEIVGLGGVPTAGETFAVVENERVAKQIASRRHDKAREHDLVKAQRVSLADLHERIAEGEIQNLPIIIKGDVQGSVEALSQSLEELSSSEVRVKVIHGAVGGITENDVNLAGASNAIVIGFNVRPEAKASALAGQLGVDIRTYKVIYDATDAVKRAIEGLLAPNIEERVTGHAEVRQTFRVPKIGTVAGCFVTEGLVQRAARVRLLRDNVVVYEGQLASLKRFKDDAKEVREGFECGLSIENYNDVKDGDTLEFFVLDEVARTLD